MYKYPVRDWDHLSPLRSDRRGSPERAGPGPPGDSRWDQDEPSRWMLAVVLAVAAAGVGVALVSATRRSRSRLAQQPHRLGHAS